MNKKLKIPEIIFYFISLIWLYIVCVNFFKYHSIHLNILYLFKIQGQFNFLNFLKLLLDYTLATVLLVGILIGAFYLGSKIIKLLKIQLKSPTEKFVFSTGLGLGTLAYLIFAIGLMRLLYSSVIYILWAGLLILGIKQFLNLFKNKVNLKFPLEYKFVILFLIFLIVFNFLMSFTTEMFYDSLNYHLGAPNCYRLYHRFLPIPYKYHVNFPLTMQMLFLFGIMLKGTMVAKLINFTCGILTLFGITYFCRKHFKSTTMGIIASTAYYFVPNVMFRSWTATTDIGLTFFTFLSLSALINSISEKNNRWLTLSAIFAGFIMGIKYTGVFFIFGLIMVLLLEKNKITGKIVKIFKWSGILLIVFSPWLIRNIMESGNPVHPFFEKYINVKHPYQLAPRSSAEFYSKPTSRLQLQKFINLMKLPWELSIKGGGTKKYDSPSYYMIGAIFLAFIPLLLFLKTNNKKFVYPLLIFSLFSYVFWGLWSSKTKYYAPAIPALAIMAGYVIVKVREINKSAGKIFILVFFILISGNFLFMLPLAHNIYQPFSILTGSLSPDVYLSSSRPGYPYPSYSIYKYINDNLSKDTKVLIFGDAKSYYIRRKFVAFSAGSFNPLIEYLNNADDVKTFYDYLKQKNFTHIVVNINEGIRTGGYGNLYFSKRDFEILDGFWKKYVKEIHKSNGVYLYEILSEKEAEKQHTVPVNTVKATYRNYNFNNAAKHIKNKKWNQALEIFNELLDKNVSDHQIFYLTSVCYYYKGEYDNSKKYVNMAYKIKQDAEYKKLLDVLNKK